jgi:hypothetical protein
LVGEFERQSKGNKIKEIAVFLLKNRGIKIVYALSLFSNIFPCQQKYKKTTSAIFNLAIDNCNYSTTPFQNIRVTGLFI